MSRYTTLIKKIIQKDPTIGSAFLLTILNLYIKKFEIKKVSQKLNIKLLNLYDLCDHNGKPFFILGCGSTINLLTPEQVFYVQKSVSFGINLFPLSDIIPTYYTFEYGDEIRKPNWSENFKYFIAALKQKRLENGKDVKVIVHKNFSEGGADYLSFIKAVCPNVQMYGDVGIAAWDAKKLCNLYPYILKPYILKNMSPGLVYGKRATVGRLTYLALATGFRDIIYAGVDLNNTNYFWDERPELLGKIGIRSLDTEQRGEVHQTDIPNINLPISELLKTVYMYGKDKAVRLWVTSKESKLSEFLPIYQFNYPHVI